MAGGAEQLAAITRIMVGGQAVLAEPQEDLLARVCAHGTHAGAARASGTIRSRSVDPMSYSGASILVKPYKRGHPAKPRHQDDLGQPATCPGRRRFFPGGEV